MTEKDSQLTELKEIRSIMERSSRFISLSGLSGVSAGVIALISAFITHSYLVSEGVRETFESRYMPLYQSKYLSTTKEKEIILMLGLIALVTLAVALLVSFAFTAKKAKKEGVKLLDRSAIRLAINMALPLGTGGAFCLALLYHHEYGLVAPATLVFYGLALFNAGKYTLDDIRYLGLSQIGLGLVASFNVGYGLEFWAVGFGILHIVYGFVMWYKYERK
jgi:general stress protein CsbA